MDKITEKKVKDFAAFVTDVAEAMVKHGVEDMLCVFGLNGEIRNTYIPLSKDGEKELYCDVSDGIHRWLQLSGYPNSDTPKHTDPMDLKIASK